MDVPEYSAEMRAAGFVWHPFGGCWRRQVETGEPWQVESIYCDGGGWGSHLSGTGLCFDCPRLSTPIAALAYAELANWGRV